MKLFAFILFVFIFTSCSTYKIDFSEDKNISSIGFVCPKMSTNIEINYSELNSTHVSISKKELNKIKYVEESIKIFNSNVERINKRKRSGDGR